MATDPIVRLAELKLIKDSADLEAEIATNAPGWFSHIYRRLQKIAAEAMAGLVFVDNELSAKETRDLQARVRAYDVFVMELRAFISDGMNADERFSDEERQEMLDIILRQGPDGESAAIALGLIDGEAA